MARRDLSGAVDFAVLESYAAGDAAAIDEVLELFRHQAQLWSRLLDVRSPGWRDAVHTVKGAAAGIGAGDLALACAQAEAAASEGAPPLLERVRDRLDLALSDIAAYQHERLLQSLRAPT